MKYHLCKKCGALIEGAVEVEDKGGYRNYYCKRCYGGDYEIQEANKKRIQSDV